MLSGQRPARATSLGRGERERPRAARVCVRAWSLSSVWRGPARRRRRACSRPCGRNFGSARERLSMARDPDLPRFGGSSGLVSEDGQSSTGPQVTTGHTWFPSQHLAHKVLHFVCELRGSIQVCRMNSNPCLDGCPPSTRSVAPPRREHDGEVVATFRFIYAAV